MEIYAEDINYWKTGRTSPDGWIEKAKTQIEKLDGQVLAEAFGSELTTGSSAYMLGFEIQGNKFKAIWPVLPTKSGADKKAARIQAATMLYHDIKVKCIAASVKGAKAAFFEYLMLPDGRIAAEASDKELLDGIPTMLLTYNQTFEPSSD